MRYFLQGIGSHLSALQTHYTTQIIIGRIIGFYDAIPIIYVRSLRSLASSQHIRNLTSSWLDTLCHPAFFDLRLTKYKKAVSLIITYHNVHT